jgi:hypothetical protein
MFRFEYDGESSRNDQPSFRQLGKRLYLPLATNCHRWEYPSSLGPLRRAMAVREGVDRTNAIGQPGFFLGPLRRRERSAGVVAATDPFRTIHAAVVEERARFASTNQKTGGGSSSLEETRPRRGTPTLPECLVQS